MDMDAAFVNKYIENLNNEIGNMKQQDIISKTQKIILEKNNDDLQDQVAMLNAKVIELNDKLNKKTADARTSKTYRDKIPSKKKKNEVPKDGGDF